MSSDRLYQLRSEIILQRMSQQIGTLLAMLAASRNRGTTVATEVSPTPPAARSGLDQRHQAT